ncbi:carbon-nitrogen hydrolase family protein [Hyphobacterium sp. HN65]|uniref:Carbon-nitrogen hydrolase family protein n=1 Tax=Hyphobacterium lacteum TaxID=3116575 RepID=A0ABU7LQ87_9PROT|nr:carbon-nitrogen hydrolase family protein [Hyphobacterium sp. HN65]MEE2526072.1 carbon-nitrogen hydrolase family protein [Hyphobacterium sp. HN65]
MRVGLIQMRSGITIDANLAAAEELIRAAAADGATFVATPETTHLVQKDADGLFDVLQTPDTDPAMAFFAGLAKELGITLLIGSMALKTGERQAVNRSCLFGPDGALLATYDKVHMFDVGLGAGETYSESTNYRAGERAVIADIPGARLGLTICYDVRFAYLYRKLAKAGAQIITVPSAFTRPTGKAHWEVLLRARAIETGSYILAPAQGGLHEDGRKTWGHSMIVDPWGEIIACLGHDEPGILIADLDLAKVDTARTRIPSLAHDRPFSGPD